MSHSVRRHLRLDIDAYDETIRRFIPGYEAMLEAAASAVGDARLELALDLGAGTGGLSEVLLSKASIGVVELLDVDAEMLAQARRRLADHGDRARFTLRSYDDAFPECGAITASLSLHHVQDMDAKRALYARAFEALRPGGVLVNADAAVPADGADRERAYRYWADHMVASGIAEDHAWQHFEDWAAEDTYFPLETELAALAAAGFEAACVWRDGPMAVTVGRKDLGVAGVVLEVESEMI